MDLACKYFSGGMTWVGFKKSGLKLTRYLGVTLMIGVIMTNCENKNNNEAARQHLLDTDKQFAQMSLDKGAGEAFNFYLIEDAMGMSPNQHPVVGRDKLYAGMKPNQENYTLAWEPQRAEVSKCEDMGWSWGTYTYTYTDEAGVEQRSYGKYLNVWQRQEDGQWRVAVDMGNSSPAPSE